jgi:hypothetical protein
VETEQHLQSLVHQLPMLAVVVAEPEVAMEQVELVVRVAEEMVVQQIFLEVQRTAAQILAVEAEVEDIMEIVQVMFKVALMVAQVL